MRSLNCPPCELGGPRNPCELGGPRNPCELGGPPRLLRPWLDGGPWRWPCELSGPRNPWLDGGPDVRMPCELGGPFRNPWLDGGPLPNGCWAYALVYPDPPTLPLEYEEYCCR